MAARKLRVGRWELHHHVLRPSRCLLQTHIKLLLEASKTPDVVTIHLTGHLPTVSPPSTTPVKSVVLHRAVLCAAGGPLRSLVSGPFVETKTREITIHERAETFDVLVRFLNCQPIELDDVPRDLALVADRWGLSDLFEAVFKHAEERANSHGQHAAIHASGLVSQFVPIMMMVDVPNRFKRYFAMRFALELAEINDQFQVLNLHVDNPDDECCTGCGVGVACRRRKKEPKDGEPGGEVANGSVKTLTSKAADVNEMQPAAETEPAIDETEPHPQQEPAADATSQPMTQQAHQPSLSSRNATAANDISSTALEATDGAGSASAQPVSSGETSDVVHNEEGADLPQPTTETEMNGPEATNAPEVDHVEASGDAVITDDNEPNQQNDQVEQHIENAAEGDVGAEDSPNALSIDDNVERENVPVESPAPPTVEELRQPWHKAFDIWNVFRQREMLHYVVYYMSHYGTAEYTLFLLDTILGELGSSLTDDEAVTLLREIDWDWEGPSHEDLRCPAAEKWPSRAWRLIAFARHGFEGTGCDIRLSWTYHALSNDIRIRCDQLANKNNDSESNSTHTSDDESESGFAAHWDEKAGDKGLEFSLSLQCQDLDQDSPDPLYLHIRLFESEEAPVDKKHDKREVSLRIKVIENGCGCVLKDEDRLQGFTASPIREGGGKSSELWRFRKNGLRYQIFGSDEFAKWLRLHTWECGLVFHVRLYVFPLDEDEDEEDGDIPEQYVQQCTCGYCECTGCVVLPNEQESEVDE